MLDPKTILDIVLGVSGAAKTVCDAIDKAQESERDAQHTLKELRQGVESLKSDTMVYKVLITAMQNDTKPDGQSTFVVFINKYVPNARAACIDTHSRQCAKLQAGWTGCNEKL